MTVNTRETLAQRDAKDAAIKCYGDAADSLTEASVASRELSGLPRWRRLRARILRRRIADATKRAARCTDRGDRFME